VSILVYALVYLFAGATVASLLGATQHLVSTYDPNDPDDLDLRGWPAYFLMVCMWPVAIALFLRGMAIEAKRRGWL
jgi:hypothetical protein